jgi:hypothetical protein
VASLKLGARRLSLWQFNSVGDAPLPPVKHPPPPEQWEAWFRVNEASYWALAWVGTNATKADRAALVALINSVHARGVTPRAPAPKPAPQVTRVLCGGTASNPRVPRGSLAGGSGSSAYLICAHVSGHSCRVWTRPIGAARGRPRTAPPVQPARPSLTALLSQSRHRCTRLLPFAAEPTW